VEREVKAAQFHPEDPYQETAKSQMVVSAQDPEPFILTRAQCSSEGAGSKVNDAAAIRDLAILREV